jgi:HAD superfamily hydrolase (TIGR01509 family)
MIRGLILDFDGLIVDSEGPVYRSWAEVYEGYGLELPVDFWKTVIGRGPGHFDAVADLEARLARPLDREAISARRRVRVREMMPDQPVLPGVRDWREQALAMGVHMAIASSSPRAWVTGNLERLGLDRWECIRCVDDVGRAKPEPDLYLATLECLHLPAAETIAVEDSVPGVTAARRAGIFCVAVPGELTAGQDFTLAHLVLSTLAERSFAEVAELALRRRPDA